jgi:hypothetical protein
MKTPGYGLLACISLVLTGCSGAATAGPLPTLAAGSVLREVHTPATLVDDMKLQPGQCKVRITDAAKGLYLPDVGCTPGAVDPAVSQSDLTTTICRAGYTKTVRPEVRVTNPAKTASLKEYGLPYASSTEFDHLIPLELGGASSVSNLWPEPNKEGARTVDNPKDDVENSLKTAVCSGKVKLAAAQQAIATNWTTARADLGL